METYSSYLYKDLDLFWHTDQIVLQGFKALQGDTFFSFQSRSSFLNSGQAVTCSQLSLTSWSLPHSIVTQSFSYVCVWVCVCRFLFFLLVTLNLLCFTQKLNAHKFEFKALIGYFNPDFLIISSFLFLSTIKNHVEKPKLFTRASLK